MAKRNQSQQTAQTSTRRPGQSDSEVGETLQQLSQQIAALTDAVDQLCDELQWRNNERRNGGEASSPQFVLHSMPVDPTTDDWQINRVRPDGPAKPPASVGSQSEKDVNQLKREISDLRQFLAAFILSTACGDEPEFYECDAWLIEWASREFDPDMLRLAIPEAIIAAVEPAISCVPQRADRQRPLFEQFEEGETDADRSDG